MGRRRSGAALGVATVIHLAELLIDAVRAVVEYVERGLVRR